MSKMPLRLRFVLVVIFVFAIAAVGAIRFSPAVRAFVAGDAAAKTGEGEKTLFFTPETYFRTNANGFLTAPTEGNPLDIALDYLNANAGNFALTSNDLADAKVSSIYTDLDTGITHIYLRQMVAGLEVLNGDLNIHITAKGEVICAGGGFVPGLKALADAGSLNRKPYISADQAVSRAADILNLTAQTHPTITTTSDNEEKLVIAAKGISLDDVKAELRYVPSSDGAAKLSWGLVIRTPDGQHWYDLSIDAATGEMTSQSDWIDNDAYTVIALPNENPNEGFRTIANPANATASPFGWHDTNGVAGAEFTDTRGNNVDAHLDRDANDVADTNSRPDGGSSLNFNTVFDPALTPLENAGPSVTNMFYWNNILHDVHNAYGFTPAAGNFQTNNYGGGGTGNDAVQADGQDGSGTNNANFGTPVDGSAPRMQMYEFTNTSPRRDSSMDNGVMIHEYGHGVSNRLTGGPANSNALNNVQSGGMGEGWSDFYALMFLQRSTDTANSSFGMGTYVEGQALSGAGIRRYRYSYNMTTDPLTFDAYGSSGTTSYGVTRSTEVHNSGELWASALWDMNWQLIAKYGYDADLYTGWTGSGAGGAGNKLTLRLVMDGMKLQPANPSFTQARDAILSADTALTGGANQCDIWRAFARRGLGSGASVGASTSSTNITGSFTLPGSCGLAVTDSTPNSTSIVASPPTSYVVNFSEALAPASVVAGDFQVNGVAATSVVLSNSNFTATFSYGASPVTVQGLQTMTMAADSVLRASDSDGVDAFSRNFRYDALTLAVSSTVPAASGTFTLPGPFTFDVNFNESFAAGTLSTDDLVLSTGVVTGVVAVDADTARYTISSITAETPLTITIDAGKVTDAFGNINSTFQSTYQVDFATTAFPAAMTAQEPLGSLIYEGSYSALVNLAGDTDNFTLDLDAGQKLSVLITPNATGLRPSITVTGPGGTNVTNSAAAAGGLAQLQSIPVTAAGTYTLAVTGAASTSGGYMITATLNSDRESETDTGTSNGTLAAAQSLTPAFNTIGTGSARAAVKGISDPVAVLETESNNTTATANAVSSAASVPTNLYQIGISGTILNGSDSDYFNIGTLQVGDVLTLTQSGSPSGRGTNGDTLVELYRAGGGGIIASDDDNGPGLDALVNRFTITTADTYYVRAYRASATGSYQLAVYLENTGTAPTTGGTFTAEVEPNDSTGAANNASGAWRLVNYEFSVNGTITAADTDIYSYQFTAGDVVTLFADSISALSPQSALLNSAGTAIATENGTSTTGGSGGTSGIYGYVIPTTGTYYHRVQPLVGTGNYTAKVHLSTTAVVPILPPTKDLYSMSLTSGQLVSVALRNITAGNMDVAILNSGGTVVASGVAGATNLDQTINNYAAPSAGTYYVQVNGGGNVEYRVVVTTGSSFDAEPNDSFATAQSITGLNGVSGYTADSDYYSFALTAGQQPLIYTTTPGDGPNLPGNTLNPKLDLYDPAGTLVASGSVLADGRNERIIYTALTSGNYRIRVSAQDSLIPTAGEYFLAIAPNVPSAAGVSVSGRVSTTEGNGLTNAIVTLTGPDGAGRTAITGPFGYFRFDDVAAGENYVIAVRSKRYNFEPRVFSVTDEITGLDFTPLP